MEGLHRRPELRQSLAAHDPDLVLEHQRLMKDARSPWDRLARVDQFPRYSVGRVPDVVLVMPLVGIASDDPHPVTKHDVSCRVPALPVLGRVESVVDESVGLHERPFGALPRIPDLVVAHTGKVVTVARVPTSQKPHFSMEGQRPRTVAGRERSLIRHLHPAVTLRLVALKTGTQRAHHNRHKSQDQASMTPSLISRLHGVDPPESNCGDRASRLSYCMVSSERLQRGPGRAACLTSSVAMNLMSKITWPGFAVTASLLLGLLPPAWSAEPGSIAIGTRRELFVDDFLIAHRSGVELRLQQPTRREIVLLHDSPWEGSGCGYHTVFRDGDRFRMYYIAADLTSADGTRLASRPVYACYAESQDGIRWTKPDLGLVEFQGSRKNNIVWTGPGADNFTVFKDPNPACRAGEIYKAVAAGPGGLRAYKSADGLHWSPLSDKPMITKGAFDTQNIAFWDPIRHHYWCYIRNFHNGVRDIRVATSSDFLSWNEPELLHFDDSPDEALYTNQVLPYYRAPHLFVGFPTRYTERTWSPSFLSLPDLEHRQRRMKFHPRFGTAITDGLFMTSRDGRTFHRWGEAFLRPGVERKHNWLYGDCYQNWGLIETASADPFAPSELSIYTTENNWKGPTQLRRYTLRVDGFVALNAPLKGGEVETKPLVFEGKALTLNFSTSAAGSIRVELQDPSGKPCAGRSLAECDEIFGDSLERVVTWKGASDLGPLTGRPVRLRIRISDADLFSLRFR